MKLVQALIIAAFSTTAVAAANAEKVTVSIPSNVAEPAAAAAYTDNLMRATATVCSRETSPVAGTNYYRFRACLKQTRADVAAKDPTGLLAQRLGLSSSLAMAIVK